MNATRKSRNYLASIAACALLGATSIVAAQATPSPTIDQQALGRQGVEVLLAQARSALTAGDLVTAENLIVQTEQAGVRYPLLHRGDTPTKARRELQRVKKATSNGLDPFLSGTSGQRPGAATHVATPQALPAVENSATVENSAAVETSTAMETQPVVGDRYPHTGIKNAAAEMPLLQPAMVSRADYVPEDDTTQNQPAAALLGPNFSTRSPRLAQLPTPIPTNRRAPKGASEFLTAGERALVERDLDRAYDAFRRAANSRDDLNQFEQQRLDGHLRMLSQASSEGAAVEEEAEEIEPGTTEETLIESADTAQQLLARQQSTAVGQAQVESRSIRESSPRRALEMLKETKAEVLASGLSKEVSGVLARRVDRSIAETKKYIEDNRSQIELDEMNAEVLADLDRERAARGKVRESIAEHVEQFNTLLDEQRFEEAEVVAKRLKELAPNEPIAMQVWENAKFIRRNMMNQDLRDIRDGANWRAMHNVDEAIVTDVFDGEEMIFPELKEWEQIQERSGFSDRNRHKSQREIEIEKRLKTPVQLRYEDRPLSEVIDGLSQMTGINIHLDPRGLNQEGVSSDTPVSLNLSNEISLKSALNLILEPLHLGYTIRDEVLKITSETLRDGDVYREVYYVADLVIPIPNFVPSNNIGLQGLINDALAVTGPAARGIGAPSPIALANNPMGAGGNNPDILAQNFSAAGPAGGGGASPLSTGPGGLGGAAQADFDSLIDLIVSTVASDTWAENGGGEAEIRPYPNNLSLVVSQTQAVHEEIADLLEQLRRLQDLQVTIEVRFIRLSDDFFERIGIDFDMNINDNTVGTADLAAGALFETPRAGATVGVTAPLAGDLATVTADLDIPFRQGSFDVALPTFGGFNPTQAATFGFAILSDIEAYFLINAAQGDSRTNVLNAPKVTLFNGQQAFVSDTSQSPFVISVIPVVGEFAAAQQPVIVVLSEGTLMSIQAVVSDDRRYVRMTVVPFFSEIGDIDTFTFDGSTTTNSSSSSSSTDDDDDGNNNSNDDANNRGTVVAGTTVQLPTFQFVSVTTTVSVPDGGTVLLGGIKRLSEGREEFGVPLLSKVPYINRLFRNVGIGRETDSLMMMVTPRIIIQEEEEEKLGMAY